MDCLFVDEKHRGRGYGRALLQAVAAHARRHGCSRLEWVTPTWNEAAIGFYAAAGAVLQERMRFRLGL